MMIPGFERTQIATAGTTINVVHGGSGPPLLLMHGYPQTHLMWRLIAPTLAAEHTVVMTDLRGYGDSGKPPGGDDHVAYAKRTMAAEQVEVMRRLGHERFAVVGHDRGGRVAHRMALDHRERVTKVAVLDIVPTYELYRAVTKRFATLYFHWFFLIQPSPVPETLIRRDPEFWLRSLFGREFSSAVSPDAFAEYLRCFSDPATIHASCEDYRAAASIDLVHDEADLATKIACPLLVLWGEFGAMHGLYDVAATWRERARDVRGAALPGGHLLAESVPNDVLAELVPFLRD